MAFTILYYMSTTGLIHPLQVKYFLVVYQPCPFLVIYLHKGNYYSSDLARYTEHHWPGAHWAQPAMLVRNRRLHACHPQAPAI